MDDRDCRLYIGGTWAGGSTGETFDVIDPPTEEVAAVMPQASADDPYSPLGGYEQSGIRREFGEHGLSEFLETKGISWGAAPG